ncbi:MAG: NlpC/P60 family protein [Patescibacteria group bacterium]
MMYRSVDNLCAVSFSGMCLKRSNGAKISDEEAIAILTSSPLDFELVRSGFDQSALGLLEDLIDHSRYERGARMSEAPRVVDCSSLAKWFYAQYGIWLPRRSIQQSEIGLCVAHEITLRPGDLVFSAHSERNYYDHDPSMGIGHVGIATGRGTLYHAGKNGVVQTDIAEVVGWRMERMRTVRRIIVNPNDFHVLRTNPRWEVETSDDLRWLILQNSD